MKILLMSREFPPYVLGGIAYHSYNLACELSKLGHEVTVLSTESNVHKIDNSKFNIEKISIDKIDCPNLPAPKIWFNRSIQKYCMNSQYLNNFDLVHSHEYIDFSNFHNPGKNLLKVHFNLGEKSKYIFQKPNSTKPLISHWVANKFLWPLEKKLEYSSLQSSDSRIYISHLTKKMNQLNYGFDDDNSKVIHNGVDLETFNINKNQNDSKNVDSNYFLYIGGTDIRKGFNKIIAATDKINVFNDFKIKILGDIDTKITEDMNISKNIEIIGRINQEELTSIYQNAIALVHPALYEPFGNVVLESLACGTPVIISNENYCGAAEILNENCGIKINPHEPTELADAMQYMLDNREQFKQSSCRKLAKEYTWERVAKETLRFKAEIDC